VSEADEWCSELAELAREYLRRAGIRTFAYTLDEIREKADE
jgi:hypothetical protein